MNRFGHFVLVLALLVPLALWAGTGKVAGKVVDANGDGVFGASVQVLETQQGSSASVDGDYVILGVQPGSYTIKISGIGYGAQSFTGVKVSGDNTTTLNAKLQDEAIQLGPVDIVYKAPSVKLDVSGKDVVIGGKELSQRPMKDIGSLLSKQPGFKVDPEGEIHVRGGRSSEVLIKVDGVDYRDPLVNSTKRLLNLSALNVQEIEVLTGGDARYGGYQSALINVTTPEGSNTDYSGALEWRTDRAVPRHTQTYRGMTQQVDNFNTDQYDYSLSGPVPLADKLLGNRKLSFFTSGTAKLTNTATPYAVNRQPNDYLSAGFDVPERQANDYSTFWKLTYRLDDAKKLNMTYSRDFSQWDIYPDGVGGAPGNYGYQYKYNVSHRPYSKSTTQTVNFVFSHNISKTTLYEVSIGNYRTATAILPRGKNPDQFTLRTDAEETQRFLGSELDANNDGFIDGVVDANRNYQYDGAGEGYDDVNFNGQWDRGEDWVDLNGNGVYDAAEPWLDRANPQGINNLGVFDPWDPYVDLNGNGRWDDSEPQLAEQDWNHNGQWDGERFIDANNNGRYDGWGEGYDDKNRNGLMDRLELVDRETEDYAPLDIYRRGEAFVDGDYWYDTGEPFHDMPDSNGFYNGTWDPGETFYDLPSSATANPFVRSPVPTTNGVYDPPNGLFDEYEMFTYPATLEFGMTPDYPVLYTWEDVRTGIRLGAQLWPSQPDATTGIPLYYYYDPTHSTWTNTTTYDNVRPVFDVPNGIWDQGLEAFTDNNNNGTQDQLSDRFLNSGMWDASAFWQKRESQEWSSKFDITSQVNKFHEMKSGFELKNRDLRMNSLSAPDRLYTNTGVPLPADAPYPDRGGSRDFYHYQPWEGALYVQDKMEFEGMIVRAGVRGDFVIHDNRIVEESQRAVDLSQPGALLAKRGRMVIAPRLGISHPISMKSKMYFNYGHYYQTPSFEYFYRAATQNISPNTEVGNPNLEYEKTVSYEVGVNTEFAEDWVVDVAGYYRDVYNQIGTVAQRIGPITLNRYFNLGYARARGFEFSLKKNFSSMWALTFNYDFSYAYGKESAAAEGLRQRLNNRPENRDEYPLVWDETHKVSTFVTIMVGEKEKWRPYGLWTPSDWLGTVEFTYGSGLPYTPSTYTTGTPSNLILPNSARYPHTISVDMKFDKYWKLMKDLKFSTGFEIYNLLNRRNVRELYAETGNAYDSTHERNPSAREDFNQGTDYAHNPRNFYPPRQILLHFKLQF